MGIGNGTYDNGYAYDPLGRLATVAWTNSTVDNVHTATYAYLEGSYLIAGYDIPAGTNMFRTRKSFEPNRDLVLAVSNTFSTGSTPSTISTFSYDNDEIARRTRRVDNAAVTNDFGYNLRSELATALMGTNDYGYAYDPIGNRLTATNNTEVLTYLANELNQYTNIADGVTNTPTYDLDGNMLTYNGWTFTWNGENRLVIASNAATVVTFAYDYMGRRFEKTIYEWDTDHWSLVTDHFFLYDGWAMIQERTYSQTHTLTNSYIYGLDLSGSMQGAGTIGGLLLADLGGTPVLYCYDANGNVTELVNTDGTTAAKYQYDPFGNTILADDTDSSGAVSKNPFRFSTKYTDDETELVYYGYRYYNPDLGRWPNRDPIGERGGLNIYGIVANSPINDVDYLGESGMPGWVRATVENIFTALSIDLILNNMEMCYTKPCIRSGECLACCGVHGNSALVISLGGAMGGNAFCLLTGPYALGCAFIVDGLYLYEVDKINGAMSGCMSKCHELPL